MKNTLITLFLGWIGINSNILICQSDVTITKTLFEKSELVLQGKIVRKLRVFDDNGLEINYVFAVDSIFKGKPRLNKLYLSDWIIDPDDKKLDSSLLNTTVDAIHFSRKCPMDISFKQFLLPKIEDSCFSVGDSLIVFLEDPFPENKIFEDNTIGLYHLVDLWTGALSPNSYLARYLRYWSTTSD